MLINTLRIRVETVSREVERHEANLVKAHQETDNSRAHGMRWAVADSLLLDLKHLAAKVSGDVQRTSDDLLSTLVDELWEEGDFAIGHDATIDPAALAVDLAKDWKRALERNLPEALSEFFWDLLVEVVTPEAVAEALCARVRAAVEPGFDNDPQPDHTYLATGEAA